MNYSSNLVNLGYFASDEKKKKKTVSICCTIRHRIERKKKNNLQIERRNLSSTEIRFVSSEREVTVLLSCAEVWFALKFYLILDACAISENEVNNRKDFSSVKFATTIYIFLRHFLPLSSVVGCVNASATLQMTTSILGEETKLWIFFSFLGFANGVNIFFLFFRFPSIIFIINISQWHQESNQKQEKNIRIST